MSSTFDTTVYQRTTPMTMPWGGSTQIPTSGGERRVVTILFCDVAGSTAMAELLDPEEWAELMNEAFGHLIRPVERYGGTVIRLMGDSVLALFGAPRAHADDPQRAILAGMEIIRGITQLGERIQRQRGLDFNVRIGINTGLVVVGAFGSEELVEYTAMGDAINVAARIQQLAEPGTIHVGEETFRLTEQYFEFDALGASDVRGKREREATYRVVARRSTPINTDDVSGRQMPFTGRSGEMAKLQEAVDALRFDGQGRLVAIVGEAGVGKSRLVAEFIRYVKALPRDDGSLRIAVLENQVSPYDAARPYAGLQARFRKVFGIAPNDPPDVVREKFVNRSKQYPPDFRERAARVIQRVMALDLDGDSNASDFDRDAFRAELLSVVSQIVQGWNPGGAFMLVGEDYHWGDAASLDIVSSLYSLLEEQPVMFLCSFRPDPDSPVMRIFESARERYRDYLLEIHLDSLEPTDTRELVQSLIHGDSIAAEGLRQVIETRSEGNPLYIKEIVNALADRGVLDRVAGDGLSWTPASDANLTELSIPTTLQALLLERIDRLPPDERRVLQQAAVLGRTFSHQVLGEIANINGKLDQSLKTLIDADLLRRVDDTSDEMLAFRHALIQDAAYETILHRHRREFHRQAAEVMERLYVDRQREFAGSIGCHYYQAGDQRGIGWLVQAADQAQLVYEPATTIDYATRAINFANQTGQTPPAEAYHLRGHAYDVLGDYSAARSDLTAVLDMARANADREQEWEALMDLGSLWSASDYSRAGTLFEDAYALARSLQDDCRIAHSLNRLGNWKINIGEPKGALESHRQALTIFERLDDEAGLAETLDLLGLASYLTADFRSSAAMFRQAIEKFRARGDNRGLVSSLAMLALTGGGYDDETSPAATGDPDEWLSYARESLDITRSIAWRAGEAFSLLVMGGTVAGHGDPGEGIELLRQARAYAREIGHHQWVAGSTVALGNVFGNLLQWEDALELLTESLATSRELGSSYWTRSATSHLADIYIELGELDQASALLQTALEADHSLDSVGQRKIWNRMARLNLARGNHLPALEIVDRLLATAPGMQPDDVVPALSWLRGQALTGLGNLDEAISELQAAIPLLEQMHGYSQLWKLQLTLSSAYRAQGDNRQATDAANQARATIHRIARRLDDDELRQSFVRRASGQVATAVQSGALGAQARARSS